MSITLTIDPSGSPLSLNDRANGWRVLEFDPGNPDPETQWASSPDTEGAVRAGSRPQNRNVVARVVVEKSSDSLLQAAENTLGQKIGKLAREGGELRLTYPSGSTITFDVEESWFRRAFTPASTRARLGEYELTFVCKPYGRGAEQDLGDNIETTLPALIFTDASIPGDVPALGRLVIDNDATADQWWLTWGLQSRYYSSSANAALFYEAEGRTALGGSATAAGPTGASGAGSNVMRNTGLLTAYQAILSTQATGGGAHLSHVGTFRVYARVQVPTTNTGEVTVALEWGEGDYFRATQNTATTISALNEGKWRLVDLGLVSLKTAPTGTQRWEGRIIAKSTVAGDDIDIDYLLLIPADEGSGIATAITRPITPTAFSARDDFTGTTTGAVLNGRVAPVGGTWATSGDATDLTFYDSGSVEALTRGTTSGTSGRFAVLGASNFTAVTVQATVGYLSAPSASQAAHMGVIARWTDSSNYLRAAVVVTKAASGTTLTVTLVITQIVAGVATTVATATVPGGSFTEIGSDDPGYPLRMTVLANGTAKAELWGTSGVAIITSCEGQSSALATGGTLATGKPGIFDLSTSTSLVERYYDDVLVSVPPTDAAMFASQSLELRHDRVTREDSGGAVWSPVSSYHGDYLYVPPSGAEARTTRIVVKAVRSDPAENDSAIDDISARLFVTPRFLVVPS